jgi:hypothetical protein
MRSVGVGPVARDAERIDAAAWADLCSAASPEVAARFGIRGWLEGDIAIGMVRAFDLLTLNRVVNLGMREPAPPSLIESLVDRYRDARVPRFMIQLSPDARPNALGGMLISRGFVQQNNWMKLYHALREWPDAPTELDISVAAPDDAAAFARVVTQSLHMPQTLRPWIASVVGRPKWHIYVARERKRTVAVSGMFVEGDVALFTFANTLGIARGRGAQSAMIARRLTDAKKLGCRIAIVETAEDRGERPAPSYHNVRRLGFELLYARPNYVFDLTAPDGGVGSD